MGAFESLTPHGEDAWQELVGHLDDGRYSITFNASATSGDAYNWSVGQVCRQIILSYLTDGYLHHVHRMDKPSYRRLRDFVHDGKALKAWCVKRSGKPLFELQIEVAQWALAELERGGFERIPEPRRLEWIVAVEAVIESLRSSKKAFHVKNVGEYAQPYTPDEADRLR